jgi:hemerythrin-like domain-containing protein
MTSTTDGDVVDILTQDHRDVLDLIKQIESTQDAEQQRDLADTVIAELVRHSVAEEMYVYPAMRKHLSDGDDEVQHDIEEHQELEETMKALEGAKAGDSEFRELVGKLEGQLRHHASDEENDQFPKLRQALSSDDLHKLGHQVEQAKQLAPTRPHPGSPHSELFHKALGPGVGFVDKLRDAITGRAKNT